MKKNTVKDLSRKQRIKLIKSISYINEFGEMMFPLRGLCELGGKNQLSDFASISLGFAKPKNDCPLIGHLKTRDFSPGMATFFLAQGVPANAAIAILEYWAFISPELNGKKEAQENYFILATLGADYLRTQKKSYQNQKEFRRVQMLEEVQKNNRTPN